ncbi:TetR/AcrR family transcriptional regulator [Nocardioides sp. SYSU D00038]|uniref:TetR/AcrR family transcriptional regulator n=1 Tax=Nocardioides sp. SYSU D00038 TaxID=2812554 RepID=UPI001968263E|nr:TetR family transcriptional regulator [Nocardioides sp. SYSU D00038]
MSAPGDETRQRLLDAAIREFAESGVHNASLLEITRVAGQRNRGAVHYHFGSREGMLVAVLQTEAPFLAERELQLLARAEERPDDDLESVITAIVQPVVELAEKDWRGRCYLRIVAEVIQEDPASVDPEVQRTLDSTGGVQVYGLLERRLPPLPDDIRIERISLMTMFILHSVAERARLAERETGRGQLGTDRFVANLVAMAAAMMLAPVPA